jgi:regulator of protease activity HflC (stomatin/prohibitin superfamily)
MKKLFLAIVLAASLIFTGCTERVPPGFLGMVMEPGGLTGEVLAPGNHAAYNRDRLVLIDTQELAKTEKLSSLCKDDMNFDFDLKTRSRINNATSGEQIKSLLELQGAKIEWIPKTRVGVLKYESLYTTYVSDPSRSIARRVVSKYQTTEIRDNREKIEQDITSGIFEMIKHTPVKMTFVATSNFDYPDVIDEAVKKAKKREIEIKEEHANQAKKLLQMKNRKQLAEQKKIVRAKEAEAEGVFIKVLSKNLTGKYLELRAIERDIELYKNVGPGDKVIITNGNTVIPMIDTQTVPVPAK